MPRWISIILVGALAAVTGAVSVPDAGASPRRHVAAATHPTRIVSLSPTATEMLFAIGAGRQVVAVDSQSDYPAAAPRTKLDETQPNVEAIAGYRPDLVVTADDTASAPLQQLGITDLVLPPATHLTDTYRQLQQLGTDTGHRAAANQLVATMKSQLAATVAEVPKRKVSPAVYWELDDTFFSADSSTFIGQLLHQAGLRNVADQAGGAGSGYPQLSAEYVVQANPAYIFLADTKCCGQSPATVASRPGFAQVRAVTGHHVVALNDDVASRWGPRVVTLFEEIVNATKQQ
jgi:iron complex transport system substrate-binding protein